MSESSEETPNYDTKGGADSTAADFPTWSATPVAEQGHAGHLHPQGQPPETGRQPGRRRWVPIGLLAGGAVLLFGVAAGFYFARDGDAGEGNATTGGEVALADDEVASPQIQSASPGVKAAEIQKLLDDVGYSDVTVSESGNTLVLVGEVASQADLGAVVSVAASLRDGSEIDTEGLRVLAMDGAAGGGEATGQRAVDPLQQLQVTLNRETALRPLIFAPAKTGLNPWQDETLDNVAALLVDSPGIAVTVVGYTDQSGSSESNTALSLERAGAVRSALVAKGVPEGLLGVEARGETEASGVRDIGYLERRVEFEVVAARAIPPGALPPLSVAAIVPSARDDYAFSQAMVSALERLSEERGGLTLDVADNMFDIDAAVEMARTLANGGSDMVILHGSQFADVVQDLATEFPDTIFVTGPEDAKSDLPNVFVYTVAAEQGAYVLGDLAAKLSKSGTLGVVGPIEAAEPRRFVEGFRLGAESQGAGVLVDYTGSFGDVPLAIQTAETQVAGGADVLSGTAQLAVGPVSVAQQQGLFWFANQSNQEALAPDTVVASQVYHFEVAIREILAEVDAGISTGGTFPMTLGNGGLLLEFNQAIDLDSGLRREADELLFAVTAGDVNVDVNVDVSE